MVRAWLTAWEWECCGTSFAVGDDVALQVASRHVPATLAEHLGSEIAATIDVVESHHREASGDRVIGVVTAVWTVTMATRRRRILRRPGRGAPTTSTMPADGDAWPSIVAEVGGGWSFEMPVSRWMTEITSVPGSAIMSAVDGVSRPPGERGEPASPQPPGTDDVSHDRAVEGWLVDLDVRDETTQGRDPA